MAKYGVIHYSENWVYGPNIRRFETEAEAEKYIKDFRGGRHHQKDEIDLIEIKSNHEAVVVDRTEDGALYGMEKKR